MSLVHNSAVKVLEALIEAAEGGYYRQGWDMYIDRVDVERLALAGLSAKEAGEYRKKLRKALGLDEVAS